jgi:hypothetical protein
LQDLTPASCDSKAPPLNPCPHPCDLLMPPPALLPLPCERECYSAEPPLSSQSLVYLECPLVLPDKFINSSRLFLLLWEAFPVLTVYYYPKHSLTHENSITHVVESVYPARLGTKILRAGPLYIHFVFKDRVWNSQK